MHKLYTIITFNCYRCTFFFFFLCQYCNFKCKCKIKWSWSWSWIIFSARQKFENQILDIPIESTQTQNLKKYHHRLFHRFAAGTHLRRCKSSLGQYLYKMHHMLLQVLRNCRVWEPTSDIHPYLYEVRKVSKKNMEYFFRSNWNPY